MSEKKQDRDELAAEMVFEDQEPIEVPITIGRRRFVLREADTAVYTKYRDGMQREIRVDAETKQVSAGAATVAQIRTLASSLHELKVMGSGKTMRVKVTIDTVMAFKPAVTKELFERLCAISPGLSVQSDDQRRERNAHLKNSPEAGTENSDTAERTDSNSTSSWDGEGRPPSDTSNSGQLGTSANGASPALQTTT